MYVKVLTSSQTIAFIIFIFPFQQQEKRKMEEEFSKNFEESRQVSHLKLVLDKKGLEVL